MRLTFCLALVGAGFAGATEAGANAQPNFWPRFGGERVVQLLDGRWRYGLQERSDFDSLDPAFDPSDLALTPNFTNVPSSMDVAPAGIAGFRGVAMYRTSFTQRGRARLQFMACSFYCRVFVDGKEVGEHRAGGFVPWWLDLAAPADGAPKERELFVLADNRFNRTTAPIHTGGDFWHFGGLLRSVVLHDLPQAGQAWVWRAHVLPSMTDFGTVNITLILTDQSFSGELACTVAFDDAAPQPVTATADLGVARLAPLAVPKPLPWTFEQPALHTVTVTVGNGSITERFGIRTWGVDAQTSRITLNGRVVKLHGWNHHTQWPDTGASPTDAQLDTDLELLRAAGTNYVRGAHYPQDQRWLDRLDEAGMAMWEETLGPNPTTEDLTDWEFFMKYQLQQVREMLEASMNHPAIMTWGWFNEGPSDQEEACPAYAACAELAQSLDPTRFRTWASNKELNDRCMENATLVSFNSYPAWYNDEGDLSAPETHWTDMADGVAQMYPGKPFVISETGAGGLYEWSHNDTDAMWTTNYQTEVLERDVDVALGNDKISGITLWHFFDFKANDESQRDCGPCDYLPGVEPPTCGFYNMTRCGATRPGGMNHKGVVDAYRRKKFSYEAVAAKFRNNDLRASADFVVVS